MYFYLSMTYFASPLVLRMPSTSAPPPLHPQHVMLNHPAALRGEFSMITLSFGFNAP
jgi:hypothetical protein